MKPPRVQQDFEQRQAEALESLRHARQFVLVTSTAEAGAETVPMTFTVFCSAVFKEAAVLGLVQYGPPDYELEHE